MDKNGPKQPKIRNTNNKLTDPKRWKIENKNTKNDPKMTQKWPKITLK